MKRLTSPERATDAYQAQWEVLTQWWKQIPEPAWQKQSVVRHWRVLNLIGHFALVADSIVSASKAAATEPALALSDYLMRYAQVADHIDVRTREVGDTPAAVMEAISVAAAEADVCLRSSRSADPVVSARRGPIRWSDFLASRCIELAVHSDDLRRSLPEGGPATVRGCEQLAVRALANVLDARAPGHSVEVRIPPYAAVQCISGPRHTRGTPAAVVEMSPSTFLQVAAGRTSWGQAVRGGHVLASGQRADLQGLLPLLT